MSAITPPYFAEVASLPCPLPTENEIESSQDIMVDQTARQVVGVGQHFVVKYGLAVELAEGVNMLHIRQNKSIPVPMVYALFQSKTSKKNYIIMERVAGYRLDVVWKTLQPTEKEIIVTKLKGYLGELRDLKLEGQEPLFCSVGRKPLMDALFWNNNQADSIAGPFTTEDELNDAMIKKYIFNNLPPLKAEFYRQAFPSVFCGHPPIFTHGDLQRKNIMVQEIREQLGSGEGAVCGYKITIIDWETSGWYPSYWEYCRTLFACGRWDDDWGCGSAKFLIRAGRSGLGWRFFSRSYGHN